MYPYERLSYVVAACLRGLLIQRQWRCPHWQCVARCPGVLPAALLFLFVLFLTSTRRELRVCGWLGTMCSSSAHAVLVRGLVVGRLLA